ncbi:MAG: single-strand DNA-binding protein [Clostridiales bacterium]|nr:single-strand DNA-binding protein [Clostridiales bacterium]MDK2932528.1 single-strand DNA-binding protein [Clostridiales bacterium]
MLNRVILMGRLTRDPELRYTASNIPVCSFTIAVDRNFVRQGEQRQADFIQVVAWRNTAEFVSKYYTKGMQVVVSGRLQTRTWDDQEGKRHYVTEVVVDETYFADSKRDSNNINKFDAGFGDENTQDIEGFMPIDADDDLPF